VQHFSDSIIEQSVSTVSMCSGCIWFAYHGDYVYIAYCVSGKKITCLTKGIFMAPEISFSGEYFVQDEPVEVYCTGKGPRRTLHIIVEQHVYEGIRQVLEDQNLDEDTGNNLEVCEPGEQVLDSLQIDKLGSDPEPRCGFILQDPDFSVMFEARQSRNAITRI